MLVDLDCPVVCRGVLSTTGNYSGSSLLAPLLGTGDKDVRNSWNIYSRAQRGVMIQSSEEYIHPLIFLESYNVLRNRGLFHPRGPMLDVVAWSA